MPPPPPPPPCISVCWQAHQCDPLKRPNPNPLKPIFFQKNPRSKVLKTQKLCDPNLNSIHYWGLTGLPLKQRTEGTKDSCWVYSKDSVRVYSIHIILRRYTLRLTQQESFVSFVHFKHREHSSKVEFCKARYPIVYNAKSRISRIRS